MEVFPLPLFIGNGPSIGKRKLGSIIDRFALVYRMNYFDNFTDIECSGYKTTNWIVNDIVPGEERYREWCKGPAKDVKVVEVVYPGWKHMMLRDYSCLTSPSVVYINCIGLDGMLTAWFGDWPINTWPSSGMLAVAYGTLRYHKIVYHGFDHFDPMLEHHYAEAGKAKHSHSQETERRVFAELAKQRRIISLEELIGPELLSCPELCDY